MLVLLAPLQLLQLGQGEIVYVVPSIFSPLAGKGRSMVQHIRRLIQEVVMLCHEYPILGDLHIKLDEVDPIVVCLHVASQRVLREATEGAPVRDH